MAHRLRETICLSQQLPSPQSSSYIILERWYKFLGFNLISIAPMVAVVVATDLWVTVDMWSAKSLIFSVSAASIATICVNFFDRYMLLNRLLWAERILRHLYRLSCGYMWWQRIARRWIFLAIKCTDES